MSGKPKMSIASMPCLEFEAVEWAPRDKLQILMSVVEFLGGDSGVRHFAMALCLSLLLLQNQ